MVPRRDMQPSIARDSRKWTRDIIPTRFDLFFATNMNPEQTYVGCVMSGV